jgi:DNA-binding XRE family transcriptional regulator
MSEQNTPEKAPYKSLGSCLREMRQKLKESTAEVSGAVEIDEDALDRIEQGVDLPSEDILMLLISHFGLCDDEAVNLWELAGYNQGGRAWDQHAPQKEEQQFTKQPVVVLAMDSRVVYTNGVEVVTDKAGVVMNFTQYVDQSQGNVPVARVGMSYEQAEQVLATLQHSLLHAKFQCQKTLPEPTTAKVKKAKKQTEKGE